MNKRICENCRHFARKNSETVGECRIRSVPEDAFPERLAKDACSEWQDSKLLKQLERRELIRRLAMAIIASDRAGNLTIERIWQRAAEFADAEGQR